MKILKHFILILFLLIIVIGIMIFSKIREMSEKVDSINNETTNQSTEDKKIEPVQEEKEAYILADCIHKYISNMNDAAKMMHILDQDFIKEQAITTENVLKKLEKIELNYEFYIQEIYEQKLNDHVSQFFVSGRVVNMLGTARELTNLEKQILYFAVILDKEHTTFSITPYTKNQAVTAENIDIPILNRDVQGKTIEINLDNQYRANIFWDEEYEMRRYLEMFLYEANNFPEDAYMTLNPSYRQEKFQNINEFQQYMIQLNLNITDVKSYEKYVDSNLLQYVYHFPNNRNVVINRYHAMEFDVMLDTYTIDIYSTNDENEKDDITIIKQKIQQIIGNLNDKNYQYIYQNLDEEFKNKNFKTLESFTQWIKQNMYEKNEIIIDHIEKNNDIYICQIKIKQAARVAASVKKMQIIIQKDIQGNIKFSFNMDQEDQ